MIGNGRERWSARSVFLLAAIGSAVGLGNIWRYPHVAYSGGGGAFLIPYFIALLTAGIPLLMLEFGLGHRMQSAAPGAMRQIDRRFEVAGWWAAFGGLFITFYYTIIMAWVCFYLFRLGEVVVTGAEVLPWEATGSMEYLLTEVVTGSPGVAQNEGDFSRMNWWAIGFNALVWGFIYFTIRNGVKSVGKVVWVTVLLPYALLFVLFFTAINLDGAAAGLNYYLSPDWTKYMDPESGSFSIGRTLDIASKAYGQIFFSLSIGFGIMIAYASFLPKRSDVANNSMIAAFANSATEFFGGIITFCILGFLALQSGQFTGDVVGQSSLALAFKSYPTAIAEITDSARLNALIGMSFFGCLLFLGIDSAFSLVEAVVAGITDKFKVSRKVIAGSLCGLGWLVGMVYCTPAGLSLFDAADHYLSEYGLLLIGLIQCIAVGWVYGAHNLRNHINSVSERRITPVWDFCIKFVTPAALLLILANNISGDLKFLWDDNAKMYSGYGIGTQLFGIAMVVASLVLGFILTSRSRTLDVQGSGSDSGTSDAASGSQPATKRLPSVLLAVGLLIAAVAASPSAYASVPVTTNVAKVAPSPDVVATQMTVNELADAASIALSDAAPGLPSDADKAARQVAIDTAKAYIAELAKRANRSPEDRNALVEWSKDASWTGPWSARFVELQEAFDAMSATDASQASDVATFVGRVYGNGNGAGQAKPSAAVTHEGVAIDAAIAMQGEIDVLLGILAPVLKLMHENSALLRLIEPHLLFRDNEGFAMIRPYQPLSDQDLARLLDEIRRFALRYPNHGENTRRVASAWAAQHHPGSVIARVKQDSNGVATRELVSLAVEDMLAVWKDHVPAATAWRNGIVRRYSNETKLTNPGNTALIMLLIGSFVLFGGLAWSLYLARSAKPNRLADEDTSAK